MCYTEDELYLVSAGGDMAIIIWDMALFSVTRVLRGHVDVVNSLAISNDASFIVSGSYDSVIKTWYVSVSVSSNDSLCTIILLVILTLCIVIRYTGS